MSDDTYGTAAERQAALRVVKACQELNSAIFDAAYAGVNVRVVDLNESWDDHSNLEVHRMERRTMILPAQDVKAERA